MFVDSETHWLTEQQLSVLIGARTQEVWDCFSGTECLSAGEVQALLGFDSKAVYYQIEKLVRSGLLVACGEQEGRAARYRRVAKYVRMPDGYQGARYEALAAKSASAKLRKSLRQFQKAAEMAPEEPDLVDALHIGVANLSLTPERLVEFKARLRETLRQFSENAAAENVRRVRAVLVVTPDL